MRLNLKISGNSKLILALVVFLTMGFFLISTVEANEFENTLKDLGNKSRSKIKLAVKALGNMGNPAAIPVMEALKEKRLRISDNDALIILNETKDKGHDALTGQPVELGSLNLRKPSINNAVRRLLSTAIGKLKLFSDDPEIRLSAAQDLLKRSSNNLVELIEKALKKETEDEIRNLFLLVLAKEGLNSDDKSKRLQSIKTITTLGNNDFKTILENVLEKNEEDEFLEKDSEIRDAASNAIAKIEKRQFVKNQAANLFYGLSLGSILLLAALGLAILLVSWESLIWLMVKC